MAQVGGGQGGEGVAEGRAAGAAARVRDASKWSCLEEGLVEVHAGVGGGAYAWALSAVTKDVGLLRRQVNSDFPLLLFIASPALIRALL